MKSVSEMRIFSDFADWKAQKGLRIPPSQKSQSQALDRRKSRKTLKEQNWVCHFCEYEKLFGAKPEYLMRRFGID